MKLARARELGLTGKKAAPKVSAELDALAIRAASAVSNPAEKMNAYRRVINGGEIT